MVTWSSYFRFVALISLWYKHCYWGHFINFSGWWLAFFWNKYLTSKYRHYYYYYYLGKLNSNVPLNLIGRRLDDSWRLPMTSEYEPSRTSSNKSDISSSWSSRIVRSAGNGKESRGCKLVDLPLKAVNDTRLSAEWGSLSIGSCSHTRQINGEMLFNGRYGFYECRVQL